MENLKRLTILAIDTSCDETSVAVTRGPIVLSNALFSQLELHRNYGGVVPSIAKLAHEEKFDSVLNEALSGAGITLAEIDVVAVTQGPGLAIALEVGISRAKKIASEYKTPLIGINHMEGHLLSAMVCKSSERPVINISPALGLLVSGGHTEFILVHDIGNYEKLGGTVDDACGEAYDKCARMLGLPYPGGPLISQLAEKYRKNFDIRFEHDQKSLLARAYHAGTTEKVYELPVPMANSGDLNLSYSGLKTAVKQLINRLSSEDIKSNIRQTAQDVHLDEETIGGICVVFEAAAIKILTIKLEQGLEARRLGGWACPALGGEAGDETKTKPGDKVGDGELRIKNEVIEVWLGGGVVASDYFRAEVAKVCIANRVILRMPESRKLMTDNAAMIGVAAGLKLEKLLSDNASGQVSDLPEEVRSENAIFIKPEEFQLLDREPILSF